MKKALNQLQLGFDFKCCRKKGEGCGRMGIGENGWTRFTDDWLAEACGFDDVALFIKASMIVFGL